MPKHKEKCTKEILEIVVKESLTWADVCRKLDRKPASGSQTHIKSIAIKHGIDFTHFLGKSIKKGKVFLNERKPLILYLTNELPISSDKLKKRLIQEGIKEEKCELCNGTEWFGYKMPLELDHKDSNHQNNNLENLQIVCPNCHTIETRLRRNNIPV